jgi:Flp pilus assembly protein TadD
MGNQTTESLERPRNIVLIILLAVFILLSAFQKQRWDTDIFWALKSGQWIIENLEVPKSDPFSYTFEGEPWIDFTWGFQVIAYLFYTYLGGWHGIFFLQLAITSLSFFLIYKNLKLLSSGRVWLCIILVYLVFATSLGRFFIRPHLFAYLFVSLYLFLMGIYETRGKYIWSLLALQILWVNIHSSFMLGILIVWAYTIGALIDCIRDKGLSFEIPPKLKPLIYVSILLPIVSVVNPYGWKLAVFPFVHQGGENVEALRHILEWKRATLKELVFYLYPLPINFFTFKVLLFGAAAAIFMNRRLLKTRDVILLAGAFYMAATHVRWVALFAYFAAPILASNTARYLNESGREPVTLKKSVWMLNIFLAVFLITDYSYVKDRAQYGAGIKRGVYPEGTVSFIKSEDIEGNIYNEYVFGGYLIHNDIKVFIDGRTPTVYSPYFFWTMRLVNEPERWKRLVEEHDIKVALVMINDEFCKKLWKDERWVPVSFDDVSVLYLRDVGENNRTISRWGFESLNPCGGSARYELGEDEDTLKKMRAELKRALGHLSDSGLEGRVSRPHRLLGLVDTELDYLFEAVEELGRALEARDEPFIHYDLALALGKLKNYDEAVASFRNAVKMKRGFSKGYLGLGLTYHDMKDHESAVKYLEKYINMTGDESEQSAYKTLGLSCFELRRFDCAARYLRRAAFTTVDQQELANIYYYTGNALFELGDYKGGTIYYSKAIELEPEYKGVLKSLSESLEEMGRTDEAAAISDIIGKGEDKI